MDKIATAFGGDWKQHPRHTDLFFSTDGRAAKILKGKPALLIGCACGQMGYRAVYTYVPTQKKVYIHRGVCETFNGPPPPGYQCRHLDGKMSNNSSNNLQWGTATENALDKIGHGTAGYGERNPMSKLNWQQVAEIRAFFAQGATQRSMCPVYGVSPMTINRIVRNQAWK